MCRFTFLTALLALLSATLLPSVSCSNRHTRYVDVSSRPAKPAPTRPLSPASTSTTTGTGSAISRPPPAGVTSIHDPSGVVFDNSSQLYYQFGTGLRENELLASHVSQDGYTWKLNTPVFTRPPEWVQTNVSSYRNMSSFWAPDILHMNGLWHLYYAVSSFGSQTSCIALATNRALDSTSPHFEWIDHGPVLCSNPTTPYNCIDPHISEQYIDGKREVYMNWGSYWEGIFVQRLEGHPVVNRTTGPQVNVAKSPVKGEVIEASWVQAYHHRERAAPVYYLFVNWGQCCAGVNSTYQVRFGNSTSITGPYLDDKGVDMLAGGGTLLMDIHEPGRDRQVGPGQVGFPSGPRGGDGPSSNHTAPVISYHYYDRFGDPVGARSLGQAVFVWGDGVSSWPYVQDRLPA